MTGALKGALAFSVGLHTSLLLGWPATNPVAFDVERAPTSLEIRLVAPRETLRTPQPVIVPDAERPSAVALDTEQQPDPAPDASIIPELQGALSEVLPGYLRNPSPVYPLLARQRGEEGTVLLRAQVLPSGRCGQLEVGMSSGSALLDAAAMKAVAQWQFKPAMRGGAPVAVQVEIPVTFQLVDSGGSF